MSQCIGVGCWLVSSDQKVEPEKFSVKQKRRVEHNFQVVLVETASWKGEQGCKVTSSFLKKFETKL